MLILFVKNEEHAGKELHVVRAIRRCDICGKEVIDPYYEWMNGSIESFETIDCCCGSCLRRAIEKIEVMMRIGCNDV